ncbi:hypothetical protein [Neobacillus niacini]|uniref:hypothetical protein n=1 Tax=Neobacillus niacini TaxID=86668 RepID=UPI001C8D6F92|nr:hypothetical protein [Neobacillus niacini]MBY0149229.1 hypothetical protein [Neobacillus niacini]
MKQKLNWLFQSLIIVSGGSYTLAFFDIGREFFDRFNSWVLTSLWIGVIGILIIKWYGKKQAKR